MIDAATAPWAALILRVGLGILFLAHGLLKLGGWRNGDRRSLSKPVPVFRLQAFWRGGAILEIEWQP